MEKGKTGEFNLKFDIFGRISGASLDLTYLIKSEMLPDLDPNISSPESKQHEQSDHQRMLRGTVLL